jgi:hypothetical protein
MQTPTITIYLATQSQQYGPIFNVLNTSIQSPNHVKQVLDIINATLKTPLESRQ